MRRLRTVPLLALLTAALAGCAASPAAGARAPRLPAPTRAPENEGGRLRAVPVAAEADAPDEGVRAVPVGDSPARGDARAPVTIVVFSDFQCVYCQRVEETVAALRERYGDRLRIVWKNAPLPFHSRAEPAAELAMEARAQKGDAAFWAAHDALMERRGRLEDADLRAIAASLGLDVTAAMNAVAARKHAARIREDLALAAQLGVDGTPTFFINGRRLVGAQPLERFVALVDRALVDR
jgi:protein-disulfide isomerase